MQPAQTNKATALSRRAGQSRSRRLQKTVSQTIDAVDMCMRTALLFDKARSVIACYQAGKNGDGENYEQQASETRKTRIRDEPTADNSRNDREAGGGIEDRFRKETQNPKHLAGK